jgi:hypothetical protein
MLNNLLIINFSSSIIIKAFSISFTNQVKIKVGRAIVQPVSRWLPTTATRVQTRV